MKWNVYGLLSKPNSNDYVVLYRKTYPSFYWLGLFNDYEVKDFTDMPEFWLKTPPPPLSWQSTENPEDMKPGYIELCDDPNMPMNYYTALFKDGFLRIPAAMPLCKLKWWRQAREKDE